MKNKILFTLAVALSLQVLGQTYTPCTDCDTIPSRHRIYYYYNQPWHDTCSCYLNDPSVQFCDLGFNTPIGPYGENVAKRYTTQEPLMIKGLTALTRVRTGSSDNYTNNNRLPEYLYLYQRVCPTDLNHLIFGDSCMVLVDSVRWDTVKPHFVEFREHRDSGVYGYAYAWDAYFTKPVRVDSVFYILGSGNSNYPTDGNRYMPVQYVSFEHTSGDCAPKDWAMLHQQMYDARYLWMDYHYPNIFGYNMAIVDNDSLSVLSCDTLRGSVAGSDQSYIPHGHTATIRATAKPGYRFAYWSDGSTSNPKSFIIDRDTTFTAYFFHDQLENCTITVGTADSTMGSASGGGQYLEGDTVTLTATPADSRHSFKRWSDGNTDNPRTIIAFKDTTFVAHFYDNVGILEAKGTEDGVTLSPNPAKHMFTVASAEKIVELTVVNASGVTVYRARPDGQRAEIKVEDWAAGAYMVTVTTEKGRTVKKMIKN